MSILRLINTRVGKFKVNKSKINQTKGCKVADSMYNWDRLACGLKLASNGRCLWKNY